MPLHDVVATGCQHHHPALDDAVDAMRFNRVVGDDQIDAPPVQDAEPAPVFTVMPAARVPAVVEQLPVDMERLMDFAGGNQDSYNELVALYLKQTADQLAELRESINPTVEVNEPDSPLDAPADATLPENIVRESL